MCQPIEKYSNDGNRELFPYTNNRLRTAMLSSSKKSTLPDHARDRKCHTNSDQRVEEVAVSFHEIRELNLFFTTGTVDNLLSKA